MAVDKIILDYDLRIKNLESKMAAFEGGLNKMEKTGKKAVSTIEKGFNDVGRSIIATAGILGAAQITEKIISIGTESVKLAAKAEGVEIAFKRLNDPNLLNQLREATKGTVSDLQLMQNTLRAQNFKIPLQELAKLFEFARRRAKETGEDVNFLVDSIVLGIGRKSPLILDNLGISAVELRQKLKGVNTETASVADIAKVVGDIATEELRKMGNETDTTGDKIARMNAKWENTKKAIGDAIIVFADWIKLTNDVPSFEEQTNNAVTLLKVINGAVNELGVSQNELQTLVREGSNGIGELTEKGKVFLDVFRQAEPLTAFGVDLKNLINIGEDGYPRLNAFAIDLQKTLGLLSETQDENINKEIRTIGVIREEIKAQRELLEQTKARYKDTEPILKQINKLEDELNRLLKLREFQYKQLKTLDAEFKKSSLELTKEITTEEDELIEEEYKKTVALKDARIQNQQTAQDFIIGSIYTILAHVEAASQRELEILREKNNEQKKLIDETLDYDIDANSRRFELGIISKRNFETQKEKLEKDAAKRKEALDKQLEQKEREARRQSAIRNKLGAAFDITISTAVNVAKLLATPPLAIAAGIAGAAQLALVLAQPIPQFAKGKKKGEKAGMSLVGERGPEVMFVPDSASILNNNDYKQNEGIITAMQNHKVDDYIMKTWIPKKMKKKSVADNISESIRLHAALGEGNVSEIVNAIGKNRRVEIKNSGELARQIAREISIGEFYKRKYG